MRFAFTEDQIALRDAVRDLLAKRCPPDAVRAAWAGDAGYDPALWSALADMGVFSLLVPESAGGLGMGEIEMVLVLEESGRAAVPGPLVEQAAVVAPALASGEAVRDRWLAGVLDGTLLASARAPGTPWVPWGEEADVLVLCEPDHLLHVEGSNVSVVATARSVDRPRRLVRIETSGGTALSGVDAHLCAARGALGTAAQLVGLADTLIAMTCRYVTQRHQFGVPIGSYQAIKHHLANAYLRLAYARPVVYRAAYALAHGEATACRDTSFAKVFAGDAASFAARVALQCHGAIGYSFEHDLHLWMKPVWALERAWGDKASHRAVVAASILGSPAS